MSESEQAATETTKDRDPRKDSLLEDFSHVTEVYDAIKNIPEKRREDILTFVMRRLDHERRQSDEYRQAEQYAKMRAQTSAEQMGALRGAGTDQFAASQLRR